MDTYIITRDQLKEIVNKYPQDFIVLAREIQKQSKSDDESCILCGAGLEQYWHRITPILVHSLVKAYKVVAESGKNYFNKKDLDLDHSEYGNFQKLRFHALIARYKTEGEWKKGDWCLTTRGFKFLQGKVPIPARVQTFRNRVIGHDPQLIYIRDVIRSEPYVQTDFDFEINEPDQSNLI